MRCFFTILIIISTCHSGMLSYGQLKNIRQVQSGVVVRLYLVGDGTGFDHRYTLEVEDMFPLFPYGERLLDKFSTSPRVTTMVKTPSLKA
jgi:hypothetical protein